MRLLITMIRAVRDGVIVTFGLYSGYLGLGALVGAAAVGLGYGSNVAGWLWLLMSIVFLSVCALCIAYVVVANQDGNDD